MSGDGGTSEEDDYVPEPGDEEPLAQPFHPKVIVAIRGALRANQWPKHDLQEGTDRVIAEAWESKKPHPTTLGGWKALCRKIARDRAIDRVRSEKVGGKEATVPTDRADERHAEHGGDQMEEAIDRRRAIERVAALLTEEERRIFLHLALGDTQAEVSKKLAVAPKEVSRKVASMRERFRTVLPAAVLASILAVVAGYFVFRDRIGPDDRAHNEPETPQPSSVPTAPPGPSPEQLAAQDRAKATELRALAAADCAAEHWDPCQTHLREAADLDPQGDRSRPALRLYGKVERALRQESYESKGAPASRVLSPADRKWLLAALAKSSAASLRLQCARAQEPALLCDQLASAFKKAGWTVTRALPDPGAAPPRGMRIEVAPDADDATQAAADVLAKALEDALLFARGPDDLPAPGGAPLRLTIGPQ